MHIPTRIEEDRVEAFWSFMGDPQATRFMALTDEQKTYEGAKALLEMVITSYAGSDPICALAITEKHTGADVRVHRVNSLKINRLISKVFGLEFVTH